MRFRLVTSVAVALVWLSDVASAAPAAPPPHAVNTLTFLSPGDVDPSRLLPPPPADGSKVQLAELAQVEDAYRSRTPQRYAQAKWDDQHEDPTIFAQVLGARFDLAKLPATAALLAVVVHEQSVSANMAKRYFHRRRPWAADPSIKPCDYRPNANPLTSYPSGHATLGYSVGYVLAALMPDKSQAILGRAEDFAYSRLVCGDHYASDTEASHVLGTTVAIKLLANPKVAAMFDASEAELKADGLTAP